MTKPTEHDASLNMRILAARRTGCAEPDDRDSARGVVFSAAAGFLLWIAVIFVIAAIAMILTSRPARSAEWRAVATVAAWHEYREYYCAADARFHDYENTIPGAGIGRDFTDDTMLAAGVWRTSHGRTSAFGLMDWRPLHWGPASFGIFAGVSGGYCRKGNTNAVIPLAGATARVDIDRVAVHLLLVPPTSFKPLTAALAFSVAF